MMKSQKLSRQKWSRGTLSARATFWNFRTKWPDESFINEFFGHDLIQRGLFSRQSTKKTEASVEVKNRPPPPSTETIHT